MSVLIGGRAKAVLANSEVTEVLTTEKVLAEVREHAPVLAAKRKIDPAQMLMAAAALPVTVVPESEYRRKMAEAERRIGERDPDDVELLALALRFRIPIWSNDEDFAAARVRRLTTAELLALLGI